MTQARAHAALTRAHDYLDLRDRHIDPRSSFRTHHHEFIDRYCVIMATIALYVALNNDRRSTGQEALTED